MLSETRAIGRESICSGCRGLLWADLVICRLGSQQTYVAAERSEAGLDMTSDGTGHRTCMCYDKDLHD